MSTRPTWLGPRTRLTDNDPERPDYGPCCSCEREGPTVRNIIMLNERAPQLPGSNWGCILCGLPAAGACSVICDACLEADTPVRLVIAGWAEEKGRARRNPAAEWFGHDLAKHPPEAG